MIGKTLFSAKILSFKSVLVESKTMTAPQKQAYCALIREKHGRCTSCTLSRKERKKKNSFHEKSLKMSERKTFVKETTGCKEWKIALNLVFMFSIM